MHGQTWVLVTLTRYLLDSNERASLVIITSLIFIWYCFYIFILMCFLTALYFFLSSNYLIRTNLLILFIIFDGSGATIWCNYVRIKTLKALWICFVATLHAFTSLGWFSKYCLILLYYLISNVNVTSLPRACTMIQFVTMWERLQWIQKPIMDGSIWESL